MKINSIAVAGFLVLSQFSLSAESVQTVRTISELHRLPISPSSEVVIVQAYRIPNDGGGGIFILTNSAARTNLGTRIASGTPGYSWDRLAAGPFNVRWFGADGSRTGVRDATAAIQNAIDVADAEVRSTVYFPGGTYWITNLLIPAAITIFGDGMTDQAVIKGLPNSSGLMITDKGSAAKINIRNLQISGNNQKYTSLLRLGYNSVLFGTEGVIENVWIRDSPGAVALDVNGNVGRFQNLTLQNVATGFRLIGDANKVSGVVVVKYSAFGLYLHTRSSSFVNTHLEGNLSDDTVPIYITRSLNWFSGLSISLTAQTKVKSLVVANLNVADQAYEVTIEGGTVNVPKSANFGHYLTHKGIGYGAGSSHSEKHFSYPR